MNDLKIVQNKRIEGLSSQKISEGSLHGNNLDLEKPTNAILTYLSENRGWTWLIAISPLSLPILLKWYLSKLPSIDPYFVASIPVICFMIFVVGRFFNK